METKEEKQGKPEKGRTYAVVVGIDYRTPSGEKRANPGDKVTDIPTRSVRWLVEQGAIKEVKPGKG
jgi:hypothetical protein